MNLSHMKYRRLLAGHIDSGVVFFHYYSLCLYNTLILQHYFL